MEVFNNLDLFSVGVAVSAIGILGLVVFFNNPKSSTNRSLLLFSILTILWGVSNYFNSQTGSTKFALWFLRSHLFLSTWHAFFFFQLARVFPREKVGLTKRIKYFVLPLVILTSILTLSPFVFVKISEFGELGKVSVAERGPGILLFVLTAASLIISGISLFIYKTVKSSGLERKQYRLVLSGVSLTFILLIIFNLLLPAVFNNGKFIPLGALFLLPFVALTSYSIYKHRLFNVKVAATAILVFLLSLLTFTEIILSTSLSLIIYRSAVFLFVLFFGILLIKSVLREVSQREKIENLATQLAVTNDELKTANAKLQELDKMKTEFVSMATHQLRSPLTAIKGYASLILEKSFGEVEEKVRGAVDVIFQSSQKLVHVIEDFLNITRIELGTMKYEQIEFDFKQMAEVVAKELKVNVEKKGLKFDFEAEEGDYKLAGDSGKLAQVVGNLIDNAIKYTPTAAAAGGANWIKVALAHVGSKIRLTVSDSGAGIPAEVIPKLFQKFIRAEGAGKLNITGTGLGLYVAKQIVEGHGGKIWAESEGAGQGSQFIVEI